MDCVEGLSDRQCVLSSVWMNGASFVRFVPLWETLRASGRGWHRFSGDKSQSLW